MTYTIYNGYKSDERLFTEGNKKGVHVFFGMDSFYMETGVPEFWNDEISKAYGKKKDGEAVNATDLLNSPRVKKLLERTKKILGKFSNQ